MHPARELENMRSKENLKERQTSPQIQLETSTSIFQQLIESTKQIFNKNTEDFNNTIDQSTQRLWSTTQ